MFTFASLSYETAYHILSPPNIHIGQWHTVRVLESGTVILECKDGPYEPLGEEGVMG